MAKPIIAVDADDTLFDENTAIRLFHNRTYGTNHTAEDYLVPGEYGPFWEPIWGVDSKGMEERHEAFLAEKLSRGIPPIPGALEVLQTLKDDYDLVIVTSRDARALEMTHGALHMHYPELFQEVHFVPLWEKDRKVTKAEICKTIGATYLIDDSYDHCVLAAKAGVEALLYGHYGWNHTQDLKPGMVRVKDWPAVREYFNGKR